MVGSIRRFHLARRKVFTKKGDRNAIRELQSNPHWKNAKNNNPDDNHPAFVGV